jgi:glycosyltransferase involved in cell wall biosynthesis
VVIVSYVFYSRIFESVPGPVLKLIDTHDVFSDRYRLYREHGQAREFFSTGRAEEGKALDRADAVLAIQEWDASHFRSLTRRPVAVVGHLAPAAAVEPAGTASCGRAMLFVGSPMGINAHGVAWFLDHVFPAVRRHVPDAELWLVGGIGGRIGRAAPGVHRFGFVDALDDLYRRAAVVINPQQFGTGLSIKSIDALRHGRPLVTTASGARGLEEGAGTGFLQAGSAEEFGDLLVELLQDPEVRAALGERAAEFARRYYQRNLQALADVVDAGAAR